MDSVQFDLYMFEALEPIVGSEGLLSLAASL